MRALLTLVMFAICLGLAHGEEKAAPAKTEAAKANPDEKSMSVDAKVKMSSIIRRSQSLQAEMQKLQTEAQKLIIAEQDKLQSEADALMKAECTAAGFNGEECQPDIRAGVLRRVPKPKTEPAKK